jgi:hypothetical protein
MGYPEVSNAAFGHNDMGSKTLSFRTLDTRGVFSTTALLDSGAPDSFIDKGMIDLYKLKVETLDQPIPIFNADGGSNKLGDITGFVDLDMMIGNHKEIMWLHATSLGQERIFIRHDWLRQHNPDIDWETRGITMSRCLKKTFGYEYRKKRVAKQWKQRAKRREAKLLYEKFAHGLMQPTCCEVEYEFWAQAWLNWIIIDPFVWDPSAEHSPTEEEQQELCDELLGKKEWDDEVDNYDAAKLNQTLKAQGIGRRARRSFIHATVTKSTELVVKANEGRKRQTFEEMVPELVHDYR